ncbi:hypothetical protein D3C80_1427910 [compost metagenome]
MRWHADRQRQRALGAGSLAGFHGALDSGLGASDHDLAWRVEVDRADHFALGCFSADPHDDSVVQTEDCRHGALPGRYSLLHELATTLDQLDRVAQAQAASGNQRAVLAQAVAGNESRTRTALCQPQTPQGDRGGENGRLGFVGLIELLFRTLLGQRPEVIAQSLGGLAEGINDQRILGAQLGKHAEGLRTLTGKDECEGCRH